MLPETFEDLRGGGRKRSASELGPGGRSHLFEEGEDGCPGGGVFVTQEAGLVEEESDPADPLPAPGGEFRTIDGGFQEIPADMGPAEGEFEPLDLAGGRLVGPVAIDEKDAGATGEVVEGNLGASGGIQNVQGRVGSQDHPGPLAGAVGIEDVIARFVGLGKGGRPAPRPKGLVKGLEERGDPFGARDDRAGGERQAPVLPGLKNPRQGKGVFEEENLRSHRDPDHAFGDQSGSGRSGLDPLPLRTGAVLPVAVAVNDPTIGANIDLQDLGGFGAEGRIGLGTGRADPVGLRKVDDLGFGRKIGMEKPPAASRPFPVPLGTGNPGGGGSFRAPVAPF